MYYDVENESRGWLAISNNRHRCLRVRQPGQDIAGVGRSGGKGRVAGQGPGCYTGRCAFRRTGRRQSSESAGNFGLHDLQRGTRSPLTSGNAANFRPLWSRDGTRIIFGSNRGGDWDIYSQPADGSRPAEVLLKRPYDQWPLSILADGTLLYLELHPKTGRDLWTLSPDGKTTPLRVTPFNEQEGQFSPGPTGGPRWVAYTSDESGRNEVYVQSYPGGTNRIAVSDGGGTTPRWSADGKELFYVTGDCSGGGGDSAGRDLRRSPQSCLTGRTIS